MKVEIINFFVENGIRGGPNSGPAPSETFENAIRGGGPNKEFPLRKSPKRGMSPLLIGQ